MRVPWKISVCISCVALTAGIAVIWNEFRVRADELKLAQDVTVFRLKADQGDANAQATLGEMYAHGKGVPQNYAEAFRWYRKAADQGDAKGENALGVMFFRGQGMQQDYAEAIRWYRKAADQSDAKAQYNLGTMYYYGRGVPQDRAEAEHWYHKAADQGDEYAQRALGLRWSLSSWSAITLGAMFLGCLWALKDTVLPQRNPRHHQPQALTIGGIFGLVYVGMSVYGHLIAFKSMLAANLFHFANTLAAGAAMAMFISVFAPKKTKIALGISGVLLILNDLVVILRHQLTRFITTIRGFSVVNGLLMG